LLESSGREVHAVGSSVDLFDERQTASLISELRPEVLVHLAWLTTPGIYLDSEENVRWLRASLALVESFAREGGKRLVWAGTCLEYDAWAPAPFTEAATPTRPESLYAVCKHSFAQVVYGAARSWDIEPCWGRIFNLYGPGEHPSRLIAATVDALAAGRKISLSEGSQQRDFLHVDDVAAGLRTLVESDRRGPVNISSGEGVAVRDIASRIAEQMDRIDLLEFGTRATAQAEPPAIVGDNSVLESLGWSQRIDLERGLADVIRRSTQKTDV
jgi:nucleoside-diphosphate-sugar epimerase